MYQSKETDSQSKMRRLSTKATVVSALVMTAFLAACGGGNGSKTNTTQTTNTPPPVINKALWIANGTNVVEYVPSQLTPGTSAAAPHLVNSSGSFGAPQGVTFDGAGNMWVIDGGTVAGGGTVTPGLYKFAPAQLAALGQSKTPVPDVTIKSSLFKFPQQAVFDPSGNLWVTDNGANAVYVFTAAQLTATSGNLTPSITITSTPAFNGPLGIAFDASGNLWVANNATTTIFEFSADKLPKTQGTVTLTPDVTLSDDGKGSIQAPWALVFDAAGNLWSSNANPPNTVVEFAKANLSASGAPTPAVTLSPTSVNGNTTLAAPNGICFDNLGDLAAISSATPFGVPFFSHSQLGTSGATVPGTFLVGPATTLDAPAGCNFGPVVN
jgi:sugar lactone lactonase YvrE